MSSSDEIVKTEVIPKAEIVQYSPANFIEMAIKSNAGIEQLERLMTLQERWEKNQAYKAYLEAMTKFQSICPPIPKNKKVKYKEVSYKFSTLDMMASTIQPALKECGLSYRWEYGEEEHKIVCYCIVSHINGHSEKSRMSADKDTSGSKNDIQAIGSARTYLERYTLKAALGLTTTDEDLDGVTTDQKSLFNDYIKLWEFSEHLQMKANSITIGEDFAKFMSDLPTAEQIEIFKTALTKLNVEGEKLTQLKLKLWGEFQKQYKDTASKWLEQLNNSSIIRKDS